MINCLKSGHVVPDDTKVIQRGERRQDYAVCHYCKREVRVSFSSGYWRYRVHGDGTSTKKPRTNNGNCHRTPNARSLNVVYRADTAHVGHCRKCGKAFWRRYVTQEEYDLEMAYWFKQPPGEADMPPWVGWTDWTGWSPTNVPFLIRELP